jgi:hypothetical protein
MSPIELPHLCFAKLVRYKARVSECAGSRHLVLVRRWLSKLARIWFLASWHPHSLESPPLQRGHYPQRIEGLFTCHLGVARLQPCRVAEALGERPVRQRLASDVHPCTMWERAPPEG